MAEDNKPYYKSSRAEEFLNYLVGSADDYPHDAPSSRMEEYLQYLCAHQGEGGGGVEPLIIQTDGTMQTSTLPAIVVPKLTKDQLDAIHAAMTEGSYCVISDGNGKYAVTEIDDTYDGVRFVYANAYLDYYLEGDEVVCAHTLLEGGGSEQHLYVHEIIIEFNATSSGFNTFGTITTKILSDSNTTFTFSTLTSFLKTKGYTSDNHCVFASGSIGGTNVTTTYRNYIGVVDGICNVLNSFEVSIMQYDFNLDNTWNTKPRLTGYTLSSSNVVLFTDTVEQIF